MTKKEEATAALNKADIPADLIDGVVMIHASAKDKATKDKVQKIFNDIGYDASWGISTKGMDTKSKEEETEQTEDNGAYEEKADDEELANTPAATEKNSAGTENEQLSIFDMR